ncbi:PQQ-dependent sugar dehydrogenase [Lederbergia panacisoli]|uniref:PQQ-dependent sugar dehydrogenase n=1 Tax=Lederbergia panacisoli TaxID=1255251 RepID=UPI00214AA75A|nr:PQQ-dependent sugar dehydrogenase [Lederbergia panacisoli]MCR2821935.1 PQQ-dependent sugar dehydrogenase [Lederbergia panacisoli]
MNPLPKCLSCRSFWPFFMLLFLAGCSGNEGRIDSLPKEEDLHAIGNESELQITDNLNVPWAITKMNDTFYVSERHGTITTVHEPTGETQRLQVKLQKKLFTGGEGGFLGIELIPNTDLEAFAYHTYEEAGDVWNRVIRIVKENNIWNEKEVLLEKIPGAQIHNGGRIKIGPDQKLYITAGDAAVPESAQNTESLSGKILRIEFDGSIPANNPFKGSPIYSYGHRNPQGLAWSENGQLFETEHGQNAHDEINKIALGKNYGWPNIQGDEQKAGMESPIFHTNGNTWAPSGTEYFNGKLYIASLRGEAVRVYDLEQNKASILIEGYGRIRDVFIEDESLYFITNNTDGRGTPAENDDRLMKIDLK